MKATLGRNKLWVTTVAATAPALTKSKRPTPVFPVPADSLKACAYTHMGRGPQGGEREFLSEGMEPAPLTRKPLPPFSLSEVEGQVPVGPQGMHFDFAQC